MSLIDYILVLNPSARPTAKDALNFVSGLLDNALGEPNAQIEEAVPGDDMRVPQSKSLSNHAHDGDSYDGAAGSIDASVASPRPAIGVCSMEIDPPQTVPIAEALGKPLNNPNDATVKTTAMDSGSNDSGSSNSNSSDKGSVAEPPKQAPTQHSQNPYKRVLRIPPIVSKKSQTNESESDAAVKSWKQQHQKAKRVSPTLAAVDGESSAEKTREGDETEHSPKPNRHANVQDGRISFSPRDLTFSKKDSLLVKVKEAEAATLKDSSAVSTDSESATPLPSPPAVTSRTSTEIKIIHGPHKEPIRDPRGDLSDIAVKQPVRTAVAKRIVLPHMRATTPVSASVPAPQITPRLSNNQRVDWPADERAPDGATGFGGDPSPPPPPSGSYRSKPRRLGFSQTNGARINNLRARSQTVSSIGSIATTATHSILLSPTSSNMMSESQYSSFYSEYSDHIAFSNDNSVVSEPPKNDTKRGLRIYAETNQPAIGKASLMSVLAQQQQQGSDGNEGGVVPSIAKTMANAGAGVVPLSSTDGGHIRKAPGVAKSSTTDKRVSDSARMRPVSEVELFIPLRSPITQPATIGASATHRRPVVPVAPLAASRMPQQNTAPNGAAPKQQQGIMRGLRSRNGLGTPLIRRALSMRKRGPKESRRSDSFNQFSFTAYSAPPPPPPPNHQTASKLAKLQGGQKQQDQSQQQDSSLSDNYDMVSVEGDSPMRLSHVIKRSKSALAIKQADDEASRLTAESKDAGSPSLFSLQS
ncbi:hypothetical protein GGI22_005696, partial [Coemansia erecta]